MLWHEGIPFPVATGAEEAGSAPTAAIQGSTFTQALQKHPNVSCHIFLKN